VILTELFTVLPGHASGYHSRTTKITLVKPALEEGQSGEASKGGIEQGAIVMVKHQAKGSGYGISFVPMLLHVWLLFAGRGGLHEPACKLHKQACMFRVACKRKGEVLEQILGRRALTCCNRRGRVYPLQGQKPASDVQSG
jgi:hypothetical protein